jgi:hypothetical protein
VHAKWLRRSTALELSMMLSLETVLVNSIKALASSSEIEKVTATHKRDNVTEFILRDHGKGLGGINISSYIISGSRGQ